MSDKPDFLPALADKLKNIRGSLDDLKEINKIYYDNFKHLTTLSVGALGVIATLSMKVLCEPKCSILLLISIGSLFLCLLGSLYAMTAPGNAILYIVEAQVFMTDSPESLEENKKHADKIIKKYDCALDQVSFYDKFTKITFLIGIVMFLIYVGVNLK